MKCVLTIAGSDSCGGAGIQADLKTFEAFGVYGASVLTVLTAQNTTGVKGVHEVDPEFIKAQIKAVLEDLEIDIIKVGMLFSNPIIDVVRECLQEVNIPIVFDPVFISKAGSPLLQPEAIENLRSFFPFATVVTPNLYEANALFDYENQEDFETFAKTFPCPILVKNAGTDTLYTQEKAYVFQDKQIDTENLHGTGCSFSSAIAANLALGHDLQHAILISKRFIQEALLSAPSIGKGHGPINHQAGGKIYKN